MRQYENVKFFGENREKQRSYYIPYDSLEKALAFKKEDSPYYRLLNGIWQFNYYEAEEEADLNAKKWDEFSKLKDLFYSRGPFHSHLKHRRTKNRLTNLLETGGGLGIDKGGGLATHSSILT